MTTYMILRYDKESPWSVDKWIPTPKYPYLGWVEGDDNWVDFKVKSTKFRDIISELKTLHPNHVYKLKFHKEDEPLWIFTAKERCA